jgi:choline-sulfatase
LRADRVGAYGLSSARTPVMDGLAREGVRFSQAYAPAPITLPSHASLMSGRYPAGHGARHNGMAMNDVPNVAARLAAAGFATGAFVSAFPLDRRFGLARGFDDYDDQLGRGRGGRPLNERPGAETVARAITWLDAHRAKPFFLWVHLFEPHAPYGEPTPDSRLSTPVGGPGAGIGSRESEAGNRESAVQTAALARYDDEVATADALTGRLLTGLGAAASSTIVIVASDHGEAFGEHGEIGHSIFVYDATLRVPLIVRGPRIPQGRTVETAVSLVDVAPTLLALLGQPAMDADGVSLAPALEGQPLGDRAIYAESFAPLFDFGWSPLRTVRDQGWKFIAAPRPELFDLEADADEQRNLVETDPQRVARMSARVERLGGPDPAQPPVADAEARRRLDALGYVSRGAGQRRSTRPDPKDRIQIASRLATVMAGEVQGPVLISTLEAVLKDDPENPQAHLRLGYAHLESKRCDRAIPHLGAALAARVPSADAGLGLAGCLVAAGKLPAAVAALRAADALEPGNPVVQANLGLIALQQNDAATAVTQLTAALAADSTLLEARFALARALANLGRRADATREAQTLLQQLPPNAPQRAEVERLLAALR